MSHAEIVVVTMVKDDDLWVGKALQAVQGFADQIIVLDGGSTDDTERIARKYASDFRTELDMRKTHENVQPFVGKDVWVFGVDGDEIYDARGLALMRKRLDDGAFAGSFLVEGMYFNALRLEREDGECWGVGYMGPPASSPTKLYNFKNLHRWPSDGVRELFCCHGKVVKPGVVKKDLSLQNKSWAECPLRCLHTCFFPRSSRERPEESGRRLNPDDKLEIGRKENQGDDPMYDMRFHYRRGEIGKAVLWEEACST